jgi:predicted heme/steroid binding protein
MDKKTFLGTALLIFVVLILFSGLLIVLTGSGSLGGSNVLGITEKKEVAEDLKNDPDFTGQKFTPEELSKYNGSDESKPIYVGLNGKVYDVSERRDLYGQGGTYNFFAGKDSSIYLNIMGGDIIERKYPVVGYLEE